MPNNLVKGKRAFLSKSLKIQESHTCLAVNRDMSFSFLTSPLSSKLPFSRASSHSLSSSEVSSSSLFFLPFFKLDGGDGTGNIREKSKMFHYV